MFCDVECARVCTRFTRLKVSRSQGLSTRKTSSYANQIDLFVTVRATPSKHPTRFLCLISALRHFDASFQHITNSPLSFCLVSVVLFYSLFLFSHVCNFAAGFELADLQKLLICDIIRLGQSDYYKILCLLYDCDYFPYDCTVLAA
jgi:hypothetical protein